ncbi:MAG: serine hydrolase, partial [Thermocrispum sp.]
MNTDILRSAAGAVWGITVLDVASGEVLAQHDPHTQLSTASVGKILLLLELADRLAAGLLDPGQPIDRFAAAPVADSGLWQHLTVRELPVADAAVLIGAVSDNLATNLLLDLVGLDAVRRWPARLGLTATALHDQVRDTRGLFDPPALSTGTAAELAGLLRRLYADD